MNERINGKSVRQWMAEWFCRHRRKLICRWVGRASYLLWRAYENRNFDMQTNGEEWYLRRMATLNGVKCILDVGANVGDWSLLCRRLFPRATIHAFEIAPPVFSELKHRLSHLENLVLNPKGLSSQECEIEIYYSATLGYLTTAYAENFDAAFALPGAKQSPPVTIKAKVVCGDDYVKEHGIRSIDVLKVDVEGMEESVLRGFQHTFSEHRIRLVQFEYNTTNIISKFLLRDAHHLFNGLGYRVGKLYPNYVQFREYHYRQEDFCGPNMIAVRKEDKELLGLLEPDS